ncbi:MAG: DoxX family protein [Flavobacteriales bacterium]|jgi:putative oxidoreductase|nr:DoxX family protein [Flavobacteriales bacterium]
MKLTTSQPLAEDLGKLLLRVVPGGAMLIDHGWPKLASFNERLDTFADPIGLGPAFSLILILFAEVVCALLVMLGVWTRISTIPLIIGMAVIAFVMHGDDLLGKGESALIYMTVFIGIMLVGSGRFSLDRAAFK